MNFLSFLLYFLGTALFAEKFSADPSCRSFEMHQPNKHRIDTFDFSGVFPDLENIDIDAKRKKNVEFHLTGNYPELERVNYEGCFGILSGKLTGTFPKLALVNFLCTSCAMNFDFKASWENSCLINIQGAKGDVVIQLPKDVGLVINTKTAAKGKVTPCPELKKKNRFGLFNKTFENELVQTTAVVLTFNIEVTEGNIILK